MFDSCPHCQPYIVYTHIDDYIGSAVGSVGRLLRGGFQPQSKSWFSHLSDSMWWYMLQVFSLLGIVAFEANPDRSKLRNRSLIFFDTAQRQNIPIKAVKFFGRYIEEFIYEANGRWQLFAKLPNPTPEANSVIDNKIYTMQALKKEGLPAAEGSHFFRTEKGLRYGKQLGFPLVVKPADGSLSKHVTTRIRSVEQLQEAIAIAKQMSPEFIVEKFLAGNLYRATVIDQKHVFVCRKIRPNIIGDGSKTIRELIREKNSNPDRGDTHQKNTTLHKISMDSAKKFLANSKYNLDSVPPNNEQVFLSKLTTLAAGCDIIECSNDTHPETADMFRKAAHKLDAGLVGFDFICPDITKSWHRQRCGIIEANSKPYADMHTSPSQGKPQPVAKTTWDAITNK